MKYSAIYRCPDNINNFVIKIKIKEKDDNINDVNATDDDDRWSVTNIKWQEKLFNNFELNYYINKNNCLNDLERKYHEIVTNLNTNDDNLIFTYTQEDLNVKKDSKSSELDLQFNLVKMQILADFGEYYQETWLKNEEILCELKYNENERTLTIYPDFTTSVAYQMKNQNFVYCIENCSMSMPEEISRLETDISNKIIKNAMLARLNQYGKLPVLPTDNQKAYLLLEISAMECVEDSSDKFHVEFTMIPHHDYSERIEGRTQCCQPRNKKSHFSYVYETEINYNATPRVYFEVVSTDNWGRSRTEGVTYLDIPNGESRHCLQLIRIQGRGLEHRLRRFFIGDRSDMDCIDWLAPIQSQSNVLLRYGSDSVSNGVLTVRAALIRRGRVTTAGPISALPPTGLLLKSVEEVVAAFRRARKRMIEAREGISPLH